ncbi:MAG: hypothetical protein JWO62_3506 [Acidimicrobiaceae bacterium]|jgi:hypothetical protein|nr:hypothetical protein [Acidimicrobiaceae bacterium]
MRPGLTDRRQRVERRLFDVHARLDRARAELALAEEQLVVVADAADEARTRMLVSETALANREWNDAHRHAEVMERSRDAARLVVADLERAQDELLSQLVI